jgi:Ni,Fe-hydrogenase III small subunit
MFVGRRGCQTAKTLFVTGGMGFLNACESRESSRTVNTCMAAPDPKIVIRMGDICTDRIIFARAGAVSDRLLMTASDPAW